MLCRFPEACKNLLNVENLTERAFPQPDLDRRRMHLRAEMLHHYACVRKGQGKVCQATTVNYGLIWLTTAQLSNKEQLLHETAPTNAFATNALGQWMLQRSAAAIGNLGIDVPLSRSASPHTFPPPHIHPSQNHQDRQPKEGEDVVQHATLLPLCQTRVGTSSLYCFVSCHTGVASAWWYIQGPKYQPRRDVATAAKQEAGKWAGEP